MKTDVPDCIKELSAVIAATEECCPGQPFEVRIRYGTTPFGVSVPSGALTDGRGATCAIEGNSEIIEKVLRGESTLQSGHVAGAVHLSGNPEQLLRVSLLIDHLTHNPGGVACRAEHQ
jgi:hypothetical protein